MDRAEQSFYGTGESVRSDSIKSELLFIVMCSSVRNLTVAVTLIGKILSLVFQLDIKRGICFPNFMLYPFCFSELPVKILTSRSSSARASVGAAILTAS